MSNLEALRCVRSVLEWLLLALEEEDDHKVYSKLGELCVEWSLRPELTPVLLMAGKSWLEVRPESALAREFLKTVLSFDGSLIEAAEIKAGGLPRPLMSPEEAAQHELERKTRIAREFMDQCPLCDRTWS